MVERKNIFLIGRRPEVEDQLTEMLAFLWQEEPETLDRWLESIGLRTDVDRAEVETQYVLANGKRPDISIRTASEWTLVESKLRSGFGGTQVGDYLRALGAAKHRRRALVLLTQKPEPVPPELHEMAVDRDVLLVSRRWHDMAGWLVDGDRAIEAGGEEGSLAQDFIQLLVREGLVKPSPLDQQTWSTWNAGFNILLRLESFLDELDPHVQRLQPGSKKQSGHTRRWVYRVWRAGQTGLGVGFGAAASDRSPHTDPIIFAYVGNENASKDDAIRALGFDSSSGSRWQKDERLGVSVGLLYGWPSFARPVAEVLTADDFEGQLDEAVAFLQLTRDHFRGRGYLPT